MFYVYVLESIKDGKRYIGCTNDLERRLKEHNQGRCKSTKSRIPLKLLYFEQYIYLREARKKEIIYKKSHDILRRSMIKHGLVV